MNSIELKATISFDATMEFHHKEIIIFYKQTELDLLSIKSYREYLDFINASKPDWPLQTHHEIYKKMQEWGWL